MRPLLLVTCVLLLATAAGAKKKKKKMWRKGSKATQPEPLAAAGKGHQSVAALMTEADQAFAAQDFATAHSTLERVLSIDPTEALAHFKLGMLLSQGRSAVVGLAVPHLTSAAELLPPTHPMKPDVCVFILKRRIDR